MEVGMGKCDRCIEEHTPPEFLLEKEPKDPRGYRPYGAEPWYESTEWRAWQAGRAKVFTDESEKLCVISHDDFNTTICLDHLGLQLKVEQPL